MNENTIARLDQEIEDGRKLVESGLALERLYRNKDFKKIILDGYLKEDAIRLVHLKGAPMADSEDAQKRIIRDIDAISSFNMYLINTQQMAATAAKNVDFAEQTRHEYVNSGEYDE